MVKKLSYDVNVLERFDEDHIYGRTKPLMVELNINFATDKLILFIK
tara:strand:- start:10525 stop:10662 length:138 start_codon:yes stop_codon:yes gene_type:complete